MVKPSKTTEDDVIVVSQIKMTEMRFNLVGTTPLMPHSVSAHSRLELLRPRGKKNAAEKATTLKHEPLREYQEAAYKFTDLEADKTRMYMPAGAIKAALKDVAIDMVGTRKAQIARLTTVVGHKLPLFGVPKLVQNGVRSSDMKRTPDIRTLPILARWAIPDVVIRHVHELVPQASIANLLANAGIIMGIGDGRQQKGYFDFGCWRLVGDDDEELLEIMAEGGKAAQDAALAEPEYYDLETEQLMTMFYEAEKNRTAAPASKRVVIQKPTGGSNGQPTA